MNQDSFCEALFTIMERKVHWAWPAFQTGLVPTNRLHIHFEQEYETYVRDFPLLLGRVHGQCPNAAVRQDLAENLYEEETGGLVAGKPHAELFMEYPRGLGFDLGRFEQIELLPEAAAYRACLDRATTELGWQVGLVVSTIFVEGTPYERGEVDPDAPKRPAPPLSEHPLVRHYGLAIEHLALTKAHRDVEGDHRQSAWEMLRHHICETARKPVIVAMEETLQHWLGYRDAVVAACGIVRGADGSPEVNTAAA